MDFLRHDQLPTRVLIRDSSVQPRMDTTAAIVEEYAEQMLKIAAQRDAGLWVEDFPRVVVFEEEANGRTYYWLADGFHRVRAADRAAEMLAEQTGNVGPEPEVNAEVFAGGMHEAILHAAGANGTHGLRRTNRDKRRSVDMLLEHPKVIAEQWGDGRIALHAHVSTHLVKTARRERDQRLGLPPATERMGTDGKTYSVGTQVSSARHTEPELPLVTIESGHAVMDGISVATVVSEPTELQQARANGTHTTQARYDPGVDRARGALAEYERLLRALSMLHDVQTSNLDELVAIARNSPDSLKHLQELIEHGLGVLMQVGHVVEREAGV